MSNIVLQFGQCGNNIGKDFLTTLYNDCFAENTGLSKGDNSKYVDTSMSQWFYNNGEQLIARSIIVESDMKVISQLKNISNEKWKYSPDNFICDARGGCGNNWALGYTECGPKIEEQLKDRIRKECEKSDTLGCFVTLASTGGGTGSGVCSYVIESIQDEYSNKPIICSFVLPYSSGDIATQNYNTILTLTKCYPHCSAFVTFSNDYLHHEVGAEDNEVFFQKVNEIITAQLSCFLQPCFNSQSLYDYLIPLVPHPMYKLLTLRSIANNSELVQESPKKWENMVQRLKNKLIKRDPASLVGSAGRLKSPLPPTPMLKSVANVVISRGTNASQNSEYLKKAFDNQNLYPVWVPINNRLTTFFHDRTFLGYNEYALLISNNGDIHSTLNQIRDDAWTTYCYEAYAHHYDLKALPPRTMLHSLLKFEAILNSYSKLYKL